MPVVLSHVMKRLLPLLEQAHAELVDLPGGGRGGKFCQERSLEDKGQLLGPGHLRGPHEFSRESQRVHANPTRALAERKRETDPHIELEELLDAPEERRILNLRGGGVEVARGARW